VRLSDKEKFFFVCLGHLLGASGEKRSDRRCTTQDSGAQRGTL